MTNVPLQLEVWFNVIHLMQWTTQGEKHTTNEGNLGRRNPCYLAMQTEKCVIYFYVNIQSNLVILNSDKLFLWLTPGKIWSVRSSS